MVGTHALALRGRVSQPAWRPRSALPQARSFAGTHTLVGSPVTHQARVRPEAARHTVKQLAGVLIKDLPRYVRALARNAAPDYLRLCNRTERLEAAPDQSGFRCAWQWASDLHAPKHVPILGRWLVNRALADYPIEFSAQPRTSA